MEQGRIAVPSMEAGGLEGKRSGHFGHCDVFTLIDVKGGIIETVSTLPNGSHVPGDCMAPVNLLALNQVNALVVGGIGKRPLMGFRQAGIDVYYDDQRENIRPVVEDLIAGKLAMFADSQVCRGECQH